MTQQFLVIITSDKNKVKLAQCFSYEYTDYNYMKNEKGDPIFFNEKQDGIDWINANIGNSYNYYYQSSINKYLKSNNEVVEVPVSLLKYAIKNIFILETISPSVDFNYDYVDGINAIQVYNTNNRIKNKSIDTNYFKLCDLAGIPYTRE